MKAVVITRFGGPEVLEIQDVPTPQPGPNEILVHVRSTALNRADLLQRQGRYAAPPGSAQNIPGLEFAGEVADLGTNVNRWLMSGASVSNPHGSPQGGAPTPSRKRKAPANGRGCYQEDDCRTRYG